MLQEHGMLVENSTAPSESSESISGSELEQSVEFVCLFICFVLTSSSHGYCCAN